MVGGNVVFFAMPRLSATTFGRVDAASRLLAPGDHRVIGEAAPDEG